MQRALFIALALLAAPISAVAATLQNGGFETGDLTGWSTLGWPGVHVVDHYSSWAGDAEYVPVEGAKFALINTATPQVTEGIYQYIDFDGEQTLSGTAAFATNDFAPFNPFAYVRLYRNQYEYYTLFSASLADVGSFGYTPWTTFSVLPQAGRYRLEAYIYDPSSDAELGSSLLLDALAVRPLTVPEPATWALMMIGFGLAGAALRRRAIGCLPAAQGLNQGI